MLSSLAPCKTPFVCNVVQCGAQCTMTSTPKIPNIRLTISVTPDVHATFLRLSKAGNTSISKAMGDWLSDTSEAADFMALKLEQARTAPRLVMSEVHAYALGLADETGALMEKLTIQGKRRRSRTDGGVSTPAAGAVAVSPPSSNTGGKGRSKGKSPGHQS